MPTGQGGAVEPHVVGVPLQARGVHGDGDIVVGADHVEVALRKPLEEVMNISINQMLGRTLIPSATTLLVLLSLFFLGGEAVRGFSIALIIGIFVGTYSSIYTASTTALALNVSPADLLESKEDKEIEHQEVQHRTMRKEEFFFH